MADEAASAAAWEGPAVEDCWLPDWLSEIFLLLHMSQWLPPRFTKVHTTQVHSCFLDSESFFRFIVLEIYDGGTAPALERLLVGSRPCAAE